MIYLHHPTKRSAQERQLANQEILETIEQGICKEKVFNTYTGIGGLHGLCAEDYDSYYDFSNAKKEVEKGQFFTPPEICKLMVKTIAPEPSDAVIDMCCGMGNFFNYLPNLFNTHGFDIDKDTVKVAKYLYQDANITHNDILTYSPDQRFDLVIGNPPFNLNLGNARLSQYYYCEKASELLNPAGMLMIIVPCSFLQSDFWNRSQVKIIDEEFSFIGQTLLPENSFANVGVERFATKIVVFIKRSAHLSHSPYYAEQFVSIDELKSLISEVKVQKKNLRVQINREARTTLCEEVSFEYKIRKYLFELKTHPHLKSRYPKAEALVAKYKNQYIPKNISYTELKELEKKMLTPEKVLSVLHRYIKNQNLVPRKEIALVKTNYGFKLKAYAPRLLDKYEHRYASMVDLITENNTLPKLSGRLTKRQKQQYEIAEKVVTQKTNEHLLQEITFQQMESDPQMAFYIDNLRFRNVTLDECCFTALQKEDMNRLYRKRYSLLNWQQGSGKTAVLFHYGKYLLEQNRVKNVVVLAPAIATEMTWEAFLVRNNIDFVKVTKSYQLTHINKGVFVLVSLSRLSDLRKGLKRFVKSLSNKVCLLFDESDEITNPSANKTVHTLDIFRRAKYKMLGTGTTTRNNVNELYSQIELLYNNSVNMTCWCSEIYKQGEDKDIISDENDHYGEPFPPYRGASLWRKCFSPTKTTVFGIDKQDQSIYNKTHLNNIISKTIITRKFKEFAGDKYKIFSHNIFPNEAERMVYKTIMEEFVNICNLYFNSTGDSRKEAAMKLVRQIQLLIRACSTPHTMFGYSSDKYPRKVNYIAKLISKIPEKVTIGCTSHEALDMYWSCLSQLFPHRQVFIISGKDSFQKRHKIINEFEATEKGILVCTQQSLKSSANIPSCNEVILESLQWNIPKMEQFYFRFIRLDSKHNTNVHFVNYKNSIEQNLLALVLTKERLNEFIKTGEIKEESEIFEEFDISESLIESLLCREKDNEGKFYISWGNQKIA